MRFPDRGSASLVANLSGVAKPPASARPIRVGRYVLHGELAAGGMAAVHFGRLLGTGGFAKTVAIKRLHRQFARDDKFRESILEEGRLAARIRHPNVVPPLDVISESGELLLVMEYVHGESLSKLLRAAWNEGERVPLAVGAAIMSNVLHGLHAAHEAKDERGRPLDIVHRDVSPQNVLVGVDGVARVIDFGIAKAVTSGESTSTGVIKGKVPYLAPEQLEGEQATRRTDVYAASVVLWEVLAGKRLFEGQDDGEILRKILGMTVGAPSAFNPAVPAAIDEVVLRGLARAPADRFATARDMALALEEMVHLATASVVGAWAERLAGQALTKRAAELALVEASDKVGASSRPPPPPVPSQRPASSQKPPATRPPPSMRPPPPPRPPTPSGALPASFASVDPAVTFASQTVASPVAQLAELPDSQRIGPMRPMIDTIPPPSPLGPVSRPPPSSDLRPPPAGALRKPAIEIPNVEWLPPPPAAAKKEPGGFFRALKRTLTVMLLLALLLAIAALPLIAKSLIVSGAQERGVKLDVERVELTRRSIRLVEVRAIAADLPGVALHATSLEIGFRGITPSSISFAELDATIEGSYGVVEARIDKYRAAHEKRVFDWADDVRAITVGSGRLEWRGMLGPGTTASFENVSFETELAAGRMLGEDYRLSVPIVNVKSGSTVAGPWQLDTEKRAGVARSVLKLDPTGMVAATITCTATDVGAITLDFAVPRMTLGDARIPASVFGGMVTPDTRLELRGQVTLGPRGTPTRPLSGRVFAGITSLAVFSGATPVDLGLDLPLSGDAKTPVPISGATLAISTTDEAAARNTPQASARIGGTIIANGGPVFLDVGGKSTSIACVPKGETRIDTRIAVALDKIPAALLSFEPVPACTPRLK